MNPQSPIFRKAGSEGPAHRLGGRGPERLVTSADPTFSDLLDRWIEHIAGRGRSDATLYNYQRYIDREIKPIFGTTHLSKINALDLDRFYGRLLKRGLARHGPPDPCRDPGIVESERTLGLVGRNVAHWRRPSQSQREQHPPSIDDVHALLTASAAIDPMFGLYARFVVATGVRRAEACGVRWSDVDFEQGTVSISRSYLALPNGVKGDRPTKTRSARVITLDPETVSALRSGLEEA